MDLYYADLTRRLRRPVTQMPSLRRWHKKYAHAQAKRAGGHLPKPRLIAVHSDDDNNLPF